MKLIPSITSLLLLICMTAALQAQPKIKVVKVIGIPLVDGQPKVPSYMISTQERSSEGSYDARVIGFPNFYPGYVILSNGEKLEGQVALFGKNEDPAFVKRCALLVMDDDIETAYYIGAGDGITLNRQKKKETQHYDLYDGAFLKRLVSGNANLYYNPHMGQNGKTSSFLPPMVIDELREAAAEATMKQSLKDGKSVSQSLETTMSNDEVVFALASSIQVAEKEYLLSAKGQTVLILESNLEEAMRELFDGCQVDPNELKKMCKKFGKIEDSVTFYNDNCDQ